MTPTDTTAGGLRFVLAAAEHDGGRFNLRARTFRRQAHLAPVVAVEEAHAYPEGSPTPANARHDEHPREGAGAEGARSDVLTNTAEGDASDDCRGRREPEPHEVVVHDDEDDAASDKRRAISQLVQAGDGVQGSTSFELDVGRRAGFFSFQTSGAGIPMHGAYARTRATGGRDAGAHPCCI